MLSKTIAETAFPVLLLAVACGGNHAEIDSTTTASDAREVALADAAVEVGDASGPDVCVPSCGKEGQEWECGSDGCGGSCGDCPLGQACIEDIDLGRTCCTPSCADSPFSSPCGSDGCGGSCGECEDGWECLETDYDPEQSVCFSYEDDCPMVCGWHGAECGEIWHGLGEGPMCDCGECPEGQVCEEDEITVGTCVPQGCQPNCEGKACGDDGCGGMCGICEDGLECLNTKFGQQCTTQCELFTCPAGQFCLFGLCLDQDCDDNDDCGGAPAHYCDEFLQCRDRKACQATEDCNTWNKEGYCDQDTGFCMYGGHCWDDGDCAPGTCGPAHWCQDHNCYELYGPGCPPHLPICYMPSGEEPLCDGMPCATCVAPCIFDADCALAKECQSGTCNTPSNDCILDADCAEGQYCSPGCVDLKPACNTEADCEEGKLCLAGFCVADQVVSCQTDEECATWAEGYACQDGVCKPEGACMLDSQCEEGQYCHGTCLPIPDLPECKTDAGCAAELICENEQCQAPPECYYDTQCPAGHVCEDQHCYNDDGVCAWLEKGPGFCDDGDPCTQDTCDAETGCVHTLWACD